jgi:hypothetical protein
MENNEMVVLGEYAANGSPHGDLHGAGNPAGGVFSNASMQVTEFLFRNDALDRQLMRKHLAGKFFRIY